MITQQELKELLHYDPDTGVFTWALRRQGVRVGAEIGCKNQEGYIILHVKHRKYRAHRMAWLYVHGSLPNDQIDHQDGCRHNNKIANLRDVTQSENAKNRKVSANNSTGVSGVFWKKSIGKWRVQIGHNRRKHHLGYFIQYDDAVRARKEAETRLGFHQNNGRAK